MAKLTETIEYTTFLTSDFSREAEYKPEKPVFESLKTLLNNYTEDEVFDSFFSGINLDMNISESEIIYIRQLAKAGLKGAQNLIKKYKNGLFNLNEGEFHNSIALVATGDQSSIKMVIKSYIEREDLRNICNFFCELNHDTHYWNVIKDAIFLNDKTEFCDIFSDISVTSISDGNYRHDPSRVFTLKKYLEKIDEKTLQLLLDCHIEVRKIDPLDHYLNFSFLDLEKPRSYLERIFKKAGKDESIKFTIALLLVKSGHKGSMTFLKKNDFTSSQKEMFLNYLNLFPNNQFLQAIQNNLN